MAGDPIWRCGRPFSSGNISPRLLNGSGSRREACQSAAGLRRIRCARIDVGTAATSQPFVKPLRRISRQKIRFDENLRKSAAFV